MAESELVDSPKKGQKPRRVGYLKMKVIGDLKKETINNAVWELAADSVCIDTDHSTSYVDLKDFVPGHNPQPNFHPLYRKILVSVSRSDYPGGGCDLQIFIFLKGACFSPNAV